MSKDLLHSWWFLSRDFSQEKKMDLLEQKEIDSFFDRIESDPKMKFDEKREEGRIVLRARFPLGPAPLYFVPMISLSDGVSLILSFSYSLFFLFSLFSSLLFTSLLFSSLLFFLFSVESVEQGVSFMEFQNIR